MHELLFLVFAVTVLGAVWFLADCNRRALALVLAERGRVRRRALPWGFSLAALFSGPIAPVIGAAILAVVVVKYSHTRDPLHLAARRNASVAMVLGGVFWAAPFLLAHIDVVG